MPPQKWYDENPVEIRRRETPRYNVVFTCFCQKFAFTSFWEKIVLIFGILLAVVAGACLPLIVLLFADLVTIFIQYQLKKEAKEDHGYFQTMWTNHLRFTFLKHDEFVFDSKNLGGLIELYAVETSFFGLIIFVFTFAYTYVLNYIAERQMTKIKFRYLSAILKKPVDHKQCYIEVYVKAHSHLQNFSNSVGDNFGTMILSLSVFVTSLIIAFLNHHILTSMLIVLFVVLSVILFFSIVIYKYLTQSERNHYQIAENLARDVFLNLPMIKGYEGEAIEIRRFDKLLITSQTAGINTWMFFGFVVGLLYILLYTSYALTFWQGMSMALELKNKNETPDILIVVNFCMQICFVNFLKIPIFFIINKRATVSYEEVSALPVSCLSQPTFPPDPTYPTLFCQIIRVIRQADHEKSLKKVNNLIAGDITYSGVHFGYNNEKSFLNDVNVRVPPYTLTCLVGEPKSGKSSFLKLLVKLQKVREGSVRLGKWNVNDLNGDWLRDRIAYVPQKTALYGDTIREALKGEKGQESDSDMINACRLVNVHSYIISLQQGYDSSLTNDLPDDVKEKLAIARVLMKNPDVLILDDCMTNINLFTQLAIITEFQSLSKKTVMVVTSKLDIIKSSDFIIYFKDGELQSGNYKKLMSESPRFRSLVARAEVDKVVSDSQPGVPVITGHTNKIRSRNNIGFSSDEMIANEVDISSMTKRNRFSYGFEKGKETKAKHKINCWKVLTLNRREFPYLTTAAIAATIMGFSIPAYATLFGESLGTIVLSSKKEIEDNINFFPQMFLVAGVISGIAKMVEGYMIAVACAKLTKRLRKQTFEALVQQDMSFYDKEENYLGAVLTLLRHDARIVPLAAGPEMVLFIKVGGIVIISTLVSVYHSWKLGLVALGFSPFLFYGLYYLSRFQTTDVFDEKYETANEFVKRLMKHRESLQTLNLINYYMNHYLQLFKSVRVSCLETRKMRAFLFSYSQSIPYFAYSVCMFYGGILLQDGEITFTSFFKVLESLILGTVLLGQVLMVMPNRRPCLRSCKKLLDLIPSPSERFRSLTKNRFELANYVTIGYVKMKHISFIHPYNNVIPRLHDINLQINERQTIIALTGFLNSGSTLPIKLLNQFYKQTSGSIMIDEFDTSREFGLQSLRRNVGLVDGRDRFFRRTVARNISYSVNNSRDVIETFVGMDDIVAVAKEADIHNFIITLPEGYYTIMTEEICRKMTPGQVLRLSLARALLRDPRLLLIENIGLEVDEDAQMLMETAILKACFSRTVILSSCFLLSIANIADFIYFFENGHVKEFGKHQKLMEKEGGYYKMYEQQREKVMMLRESRLFGIEED
ncbi:hypothetical protein RUM44_006824 [Polyplax serrata]|uniref:Uncharacterized protein n=1 Tax=Polyplax serrata TaxID=468196 RepID=A0ABR1AJ81_POLSC